MTEGESKKTYRLEEVREHTSGRSCWVVIHDKIYDVTKFLEEHPGGEEVLLEQGGQDASESFEDVGHSMDARDLMAQYHIGDLAEEDRKTPVSKKHGTEAGGGMETSSSNLPVLLVTVTVAVALIAVLAFKLMSS